MPSQFPRGSTVYDKYGRSYVVEEVEAGTVFCTADNGAEVDFPESALTLAPPAGAPTRSAVYHSDEDENVADYRRGEPHSSAAPPRPAATTRPGSARVPGPKREVSYERVRASRHYIAPKEKLDAAACKQLLEKLNRLQPGLIDFAAYETAARALDDIKEDDLVSGLLIAKCREVWNAAPIEARASLMAELLGTPAKVLTGMAHTGDFLMRAMIEKGMAVHGDAYAAFTKKAKFQR